MRVKILFPADHLEIKDIDPNYETEYRVVRSMLEFEPVFYSYRELVQHGVLITYPQELDEGLCIYRGWMLKPSIYQKLCETLQGRGVRLVNDIPAYEYCHLFPNSYEAIQAHTPKTRWYENFKEIDWAEINREFERFMIKDYVKSVKGTAFPSCFVTPVDADAMREAVDAFIRLRGALFTGGIVLKAFVDLKRYGTATNEYRAFYLYGKVLTVSRNSNQSEECPFVPREYVDQFSALESNFYTVDFAELDSGEWIVIEVGDGQVSGLSPEQYVFKFYDEMRAIILHHAS